MGATVCSAQKNILDLNSFYKLISLEKLEDNIKQEYVNHRMKSFSYIIPEKYKKIYNFLRGKVDDDAFIQQEKQRLQKMKQSSKNNQFIKSLRYYGIQQLLDLEQTYKNDDYTFEILKLSKTLQIYIYNVSYFLKKCGSKYYYTLYLRLWEYYKNKIQLLEQIYSFDFLNTNNTDRSIIKFSFEKFSKKLWAHQIQMNMNKEIVLNLLDEKFENSQIFNNQLQKYFSVFLDISIDQEQINYCGNIGMKLSEQFLKFLGFFYEALKQKFSSSLDPINDILDWVQNNNFLNKVIPQQLRVFKLFPIINQLLNEQLSIIFKQLYNCDKQYILFTDKEQNIDEVEKNQTISQFTLSSQQQTNYSSFNRANYYSEQEETSFYNIRKSKWQQITEVNKNQCNEFIEYKQKIKNWQIQNEDERKKIFKIFEVNNYKKQEFLIFSMNILYDYQYQINNKELDELEIGFCLYF